MTSSTALAMLSQIGFTVVGASIIAWTVLKLAGKSWLKSWFDKDLEEFKREKAQELETFKAEREQLLEQLRHAQGREMEAHKHRFQRMLDRASKLHQYEFDVLPEIWDRLTKALSATAMLVARGQSYPQTRYMGEGELEEFLIKLDILHWQKAELRKESPENRDERLITMLNEQRLRQAAVRHEDFHNYLISRGIFLRTELRETIRELSNLNYAAFSEYRLDLQMGDDHWQDRHKNRDLFNSQWLAKMNVIQTMVEDRLWETGLLQES